MDCVLRKSIFGFPDLPAEFIRARGRGRSMRRRTRRDESAGEDEQEGRGPKPPRVTQELGFPRLIADCRRGGFASAALSNQPSAVSRELSAF